MANRNRNNSTGSRQHHAFRRGQWAEVRSIEDIQATLDADGKLDGIPFMPEMIKYCGRKSRVAHRADRIFLDHYNYVAGLKDTVLLEGLRCDGQSHNGCQMHCELLWKEAWLKPADPPNTPANVADTTNRINLNLPTRKGDRFTCQATELVHASSPLPWWDPRQYVREVVTGETTTGELFKDLVRRARQKVSRMIKPLRGPTENPLNPPTPTECLNLQAGQWVEVKSLAEIQATLDDNGYNRGLAFAQDQAAFCGKRFRVARRVEKLILEWSGEMRAITNTVELDEVTCRGRSCRSCPRNCYHLWREIWLRRVPEPG